MRENNSSCIVHHPLFTNDVTTIRHVAGHHLDEHAWFHDHESLAYSSVSCRRWCFAGISRCRSHVAPCRYSRHISDWRLFSERTTACMQQQQQQQRRRQVPVTTATPHRTLCCRSPYPLACDETYDVIHCNHNRPCRQLLRFIRR